MKLDDRGANKLPTVVSAQAVLFSTSGGATGGGDAPGFTSGQPVATAPRARAEEAAVYVTCNGV